MMNFAIVAATSPFALKLRSSLSPSPSSYSDNLSIFKRRVETPEPDQTKLAIPLSGYKWRLGVAYDGTNYAGWQYQSTPPTIQCILENALTQITKLERKDLHLVGASRTDTGVHAWGQVAHFLTPFNYDGLEEIHSALNGLLPRDIRIREVSPALPEFHARSSARCKVHHYKIFHGTVMEPFQRFHAYHNAFRLSVSAMREAAKHFVGEHDFSAFVSASRNDGVPDPVKIIYRFDIVEMGDLGQFRNFLFHFSMSQILISTSQRDGSLTSDF